MKKALALSLAVAMSFGMSGSVLADSTAESKIDGSGIRVCIVYTGNLGDKSYNDSCNEGAQRAVKDFGIELKSLEGSTADEWKANLLSACEDGYDLVIGASSNIDRKSVV